ncbi:hypothetical protein [Arcanobacterium phocae]|uniref:hypothetical protein n=1 Tax=Arcanobacterium phocae TaxID=131112 RepID=UPI001C0EA218|nr:hypothetical protein [Arcanobacterium phocae]
MIFSMDSLRPTGTTSEPSSSTVPWITSALSSTAIAGEAANNIITAVTAALIP